MYKSQAVKEKEKKASSKKKKKKQKVDKTTTGDLYASMFADLDDNDGPPDGSGGPKASE